MKELPSVKELRRPLGVNNPKFQSLYISIQKFQALLGDVKVVFSHVPRLVLAGPW